MLAKGEIMNPFATTLRLDSFLTHGTSKKYRILLSGQVAVPTHCFKAALFMTDDSVITELAYLMPNQSETLPGDPEDYEIGVEKIEEITGWEFFVDVP
ncbi:MAG: DNA/RNA non-specific endonuclease [candidate division Zixibacteria bacterium]|nr:DNA/RNA non-specific endonuclease [candidate division Zixibacteria bacterium]MBU2624809.1 DNA/RNA non-specific endonuclease [candidate division Zixibacteria bacterium]